jgi:hypothetical protein
MRAKSGDQLVIRGHRVGNHDRYAEILEVRGTKEEPSYLVRWAADGHESVVYPGSDAVIERRSKKTLAKT